MVQNELKFPNASIYLVKAVIKQLFTTTAKTSEGFLFFLTLWLFVSVEPHHPYNIPGNQCLDS